VWFVSDVINGIRTKGIFKNDLYRFDSFSEFISSNYLSRAATLFVRLLPHKRTVVEPRGN
jgi:hypothetical protein